jgi:hypothetical protein
VLPAPVVTHQIETAEELVDRLRPTHCQWEGDASRWIFRGHADAGWKLVPTALRKTSWEPFDPNFEPMASSASQREERERTVLKLFGNALDRAGLPVLLTRERLDQLDSEPSNGLQWQDEYVELIALAQHHGIPTKLLDFSRSGLVAAYFAARDASELCVWAIDAAFFSLRVESAPDAVLVRGSGALNPNQHAQDGVFAIWGDDNPLDQVISDIVTRVRETPAAVASETRRSARGRDAERLARGTMARQFVVPRGRAMDLMGLLSHERISGATMFPGIDGVVLGLKERHQHGTGAYDLWSER